MGTLPRRWSGCCLCLFLSSAVQTSAWHREACQLEIVWCSQRGGEAILKRGSQDLLEAPTAWPSRANSLKCAVTKTGLTLIDLSWPSCSLLTIKHHHVNAAFSSQQPEWDCQGWEGYWLLTHWKIAWYRSQLLTSPEPFTLFTVNNSQVMTATRDAQEGQRPPHFSHPAALWENKPGCPV